MRERRPIDTALRIEDERKALSDVQKKIQERQAAAGALKLPPLLDERRLKYAIPDGAFRTQAVFDRILVWQIPDWEGETYGDTLIVMPELAKAKTAEGAPRGILVSAGQLAMDGLRSNGIEIGHVVAFIRLAPWRLRVDTVGGREQHLLVLRSGDLIGSEDLRSELLERPDAIRLDPETGEHNYHAPDGVRVRATPEQPDDY